MDVNERQTPTSLLAHPIFQQLNTNRYKQKRTLLSKPVVSFEKHYYRRLAQLQQPNAPVLIGKKQLYEIARLKVNATDPKTTFATFLKEQLDAKEEQSLLT